jgi:cephalosporin hydroxylase
MNEYYKNIPSGDMFDFETFYDMVANGLPHECRVVEIGLSNGRSLLYLAAKLQEMGKEAKVIGIDNMAYGGAGQRNEIISHIIKSGLEVELLEMSSLDASTKFPDGYFDFVFIDSSHTFEQTKAEILLWRRKLKDGRILAGHDYNFQEGKEVLEAVNLLIPDVMTHGTRNGFNVWYTIK